MGFRYLLVKKNIFIEINVDISEGREKGIQGE